MTKLAFTLAAAFLAACTTVSPISPIGANSYMVGTSVRGGFTSDTEVKTIALQRANEFCRGMGKSMTLTSSQSSGVQGWTPQNSEVIFSCNEDPSQTKKP
jgi:hypothetical protein